MKTRPKVSGANGGGRTPFAVSSALGRRHRSLFALDFMNPIQSYFQWHDARYLERAEDPKKNRADIRMYHTLRVVLLLATVLAGTFLVAATALIVCSLGSLPEYWLPVLSVLFGYGALLYMWTTEALLFRRYIEDQKKI